MPAALDTETRSRIAFYSALGYSQQDISEKLEISRTSVRKYQTKIREAVEASVNPTDTLVAIVANEYEWEYPERPISFGDHPM